MPAKAIIQVRRDTASNWTSTNPTLAAGEIGFESNTNKFKFGTGSTAWNSLAYTTAGVAVSTTAPSSPSAGDIWYNSTDGTAYIYYDNFWVDLNPGITGPAGKFTVSATAPSSPETGDGWFNSTTARLFIYYDDFWIEATSNYIGPQGASGVIAVTSPITNSGTSTSATIGINQSAIAVNASQVASTVSDKSDNYTVLTSDKNSLIRVTAATDKTVTIGTATAFQVGDRIDILQDGEGVVTVNVTGDATLAGRGTAGTAYTIGQQYDAVSVVCVDTNSYRIIGNATAV